MAITVSISTPTRRRLVRRARLLAWTGNVWHPAEFGIALGSGIAASSIALIGFGLDAFVEMFAGMVVVWRFAAHRDGTAERRAQQLIATSFFCLAAYVGAESIDTLVAGQHPGTSWVGIGLAAFTAPTMPLLAVDPGAALVISALAVRQGRSSWRGDACCDPC